MFHRPLSVFLVSTVTFAFTLSNDMQVSLFYLLILFFCLFVSFCSHLFIFLLWFALLTFCWGGQCKGPSGFKCVNIVNNVMQFRLVSVIRLHEYLWNICQTYLTTISEIHGHRWKEKKNHISISFENLFWRNWLPCISSRQIPVTQYSPYNFVHYCLFCYLLHSVICVS